MFGFLLLLFLTPSAAADANNSNHEIHLEITTYLGDRQTFVAGDRLSFLVSLDHDAYLLVLYQTAQQQLIQLLPHKYSHAQTYKAGYYIPVPDEQARYQFVIAPPFGKEKIMAFASTRPFTPLDGTPLSNGLRQLSGSLAEITQKLRKESEEEKSSFGEAELELTTRAR